MTAMGGSGVPAGLTDLAWRRDAGRRQRSLVPLDSHAELPPVSGRRDPVAILVAQDGERVSSLLPIRHGRMSASTPAFYRGSASVMASDLSRTRSTALFAQLCGDAHPSNFGLFEGPDERLVFDIEQYDETAPGPFEWDVKRLATGIAIAARHNGLSPTHTRRATRSAVKGYRKAIVVASRQSPLQRHYQRSDFARLIPEDGRDGVKEAVDEPPAQTDTLPEFRRLIETIDGEHRFVAHPPLVQRIGTVGGGDLRTELENLYRHYVSTLPPEARSVLDGYQVVDLAHVLAGLGGVGKRCFILLLTSDAGDPVVLQARQVDRSVLEPLTGPPNEAEAGERVVRGQRKMQTCEDLFVGWSRLRTGGRLVDFHFRQLREREASLEPGRMGPRELRRYARVCGETLAIAHAKSGDALAISAYLGDSTAFDRAVADFAESYADLARADHRAHDSAIASGRIEATAV